MRKWPTAVLLLIGACAAPPDSGSDPVLDRLRAGEAPRELQYDRNPVWTAEIGEALKENRLWKSDRDALSVIVYFAANAGPDHLPVVEALLKSDRPELRMRGLLIARLSTSVEMLDLLDRYAPALLDPAKPEVARVALGAMGHRRARGSTEAILEYLLASEDPAALRALGRIWEGGPDGPQRTAVYLVAHKLTMGAGATPESADALLRVMSDAEVEEFLGKWAGEKFAARSLIVEAAGAKDFPSGRGRKVHGAFLANPDGALVASILLTSRHRPDRAAVVALLDDDREEASMAAAARLESMETGLRPEPPVDPAARARLLKKWRERR
jgi:hypothetical protein